GGARRGGRVIRCQSSIGTSFGSTAENTRAQTIVPAGFMAGPPRMGSQTAILRQVVRLVSFGAAATQKARRIRKPVRYVGGPSGTLWRKAVGPFLSMWINAR